MLGEANRDLALRAVKLRLRLEHIEGSVERARARRVPGPLVVLLAQPGTKAFAANRPGFPVAVDDEIGIGGAVGRVEELGRRLRHSAGCRCCSRRSTVARRAFDSLIGLRIPSCHWKSRQSVVSSGAPRRPACSDLVDH